MCRDTFVLHEKRNEFRGLRLTRISTYHVNIGWAFIESLTSCQGRFPSTTYLHYDGPFQHVDKHMSIVAMYGLKTTGRVYNSDHGALFPWEPCEIPRQQGFYLNLLRNQPTGRQPRQAQH